MRSRAGHADRQSWDALDGALTTLRLCMTTTEFIGCAAELALVGCGADAAALGQITDGIRRPWLCAGETALLAIDGTALSGSDNVTDGDSDLAIDQQVIQSRRTFTGRISTLAGDRQIVIAPVGSAGTIVGLLQTVGRDLDLDIVETFADGLGSMWTLIRARQRADELGYVLTRLRSTLGNNPSRHIELTDRSLDLSAGPVRIVKSYAEGTELRTSLTARQREVLDLMVAGLSNSEIADRLVVALPTVKSHVRAVLRASGAVNRSEAVARFARSGGSARSAR